jgi:leishmanolysin-like peptidase
MNYSFAEQLVWGRGDGCGYVAGSCGGYIKSQKLKLGTYLMCNIKYFIKG